MLEHLRALARLLLLCAGMPAALAQSGMALDGSFAVNESGAATYAIPIKVAPGTGGLVPALSLQYSSQSGNGVAGVGWSLAGLSVISRCPRTLVQDSVAGSVNLDADDRFCLDGQRLVVVSGLYGADGAEYRTERDSFTRVVSYGRAGDGPLWFKAWTKAGQILSFGSTDSARVDAQGKAVVRAWALDRLEDTRGNYLAVSYLKDMTLGVHLPQRIVYTGNERSGLQPYNAVQLVYEARPDMSTVWQAGAFMRHGMRLSRIQVFTDNAQLRSYRVLYETEVATRRSRPAMVSECDANEQCLPPLTFQYGPNQAARFGGSFAQVIGDWGYDAGRAWVDIDGDGRADFCRVIGADGDTRLSCILSTGVAFGALRESRAIDPGWGAGRAWVDVNGDGRPDYCRVVGASGAQKLACEISTDAGFGATIVSAVLDAGYEAGRAWVDVDGDGRADYCRIVGGDARMVACTLSTGSGFGATITSPVLDTGFDEGRAWVDVNGDGKADFCRVVGRNDQPESRAAMCTLSNGTGFGASIRSEALDWGDADGRAWVDMNGDGKADFCRLTTVNLPPGSAGLRRLACALSTGSGFTQSYYSADLHDPGYREGRNWVDINGDGMADYCRVVGTELTRHMRCTLSTGNGFGDTIISDYTDPGYDSGRAWVDVNGDGVPDFCRAVGADAASTRALECTLGSLNSTGIVAIDNGIGRGTWIDYAPLTDASVYTKGSSATYPRADLQMPLYVVRSVRVSNGAGGTVESQYRHAGLAADFSGRGLLGFAASEIREVSAGLFTRISYRQDFPYVGLVSQLTKTTSPTSWTSGILREIRNDYDCIDPASGGACRVAPYQRYFTFNTRSVERAYDVDGSAVPVVTTSAQYDRFGNATEVAVVTSDGFSKLTSNSYANDERNWILGRLLRSRVTNTVP